MICVLPVKSDWNIQDKTTVLEQFELLLKDLRSGPSQNVSLSDLCIEWVIAIESFSRMPQFELEQALEWMAQYKTHDFKFRSKFVLEWDVLMRQDEFASISQKILPIIDQFDSVRVADSGAFGFLMRHSKTCTIDWIVESGNCNFGSLQGWCEWAKERLGKLVLSIQLPAAKLASMIQSLRDLGFKGGFEILTRGPILLLYTPRNLLSPHSPEILQAYAHSPESGHQGFRVIQNSAGTLIFHSKDYDLVDQLGQLLLNGMTDFRFDSRGLAPKGSFKCFYRANSTDVLFKKLKNVSIQRQDKDFLGEILESERAQYMVLHNQSRSQVIKLGQTLALISPDHKKSQLKLEWIKSLSLEPVVEILPGEMALIPWVKYGAPKAVLYTEVLDENPPN